MTYVTDYITRGGVGIEIEIPLNSQGQPLWNHMTDSEKRRAKAVMLREQLGALGEKEYVTIH